jgi:predicted small integral membrane protein
VRLFYPEGARNSDDAADMKRGLGTMALLVMLGALLVFLFPAACGSFTATNGPATAFRAAAAVLQMLLLLCHVRLIAQVEAPGAAWAGMRLADPGGEVPAPLNLRC